MTSMNKPSRFCGIDVAKDKHLACVIDREGDLIVRSQSFTNDARGYQLILERLQEVGGPAQVAIAMEATGHYWYSLHDFLIGQSYPVAVLNPLQTARQVTKGIRKSQTDRIDAHHIAVLLNNGEHRPALIPGELGLTCRRLTRLHLAMAHRACKQEGDLRDYWLRRKAKGLKYREAIIATAIKLCPVVWRIMTDCRPYLPQRPVTTKP